MKSGAFPQANEVWKDSRNFIYVIESVSYSKIKGLEGEQLVNYRDVTSGETYTTTTLEFMQTVYKNNKAYPNFKKVD